MQMNQQPLKLEKKVITNLRMLKNDHKLSKFKNNIILLYKIRHQCLETTKQGETKPTAYSQVKKSILTHLIVYF
jgi:hypothetical protein